LALALIMLLSLMPAITVGAAANSEITAYVTVSYEGSPLEATSGGTVGASTGKKMVCIPVELSSSSATVKDALTTLAKQYYKSGYSFPTDCPDNYLDNKSDYWGVATNNNLSNVASDIRVNGVEATGGVLTDGVNDGDNIIADMGVYDNKWNPQMMPTCISDTGGSYLGYRELSTGTNLSFKVGYYAYSTTHYNFSLAGIVSSGCSVYVTKNLSDLGTELIAASGSYSYKFSTPGTYYILAMDSASDTTYYDASAEKIVVKDTITNSAPSLKTGISSTATASTYVGKPYALDLSTIFKDVNGDSLTYYAKVAKVDKDDSFSEVFGSTYSYTPTTVDTYTLTFKANDKQLDSATYEVKLTVAAAPAYAAVLTGLSSYYAALSGYTDTNDQWGIADLMACNASKLTTAQKSAVLEQLISNAYTAHDSVPNLTDKNYNSCAGTLARCIITLKSLGYDARYVKAGGKTPFDAVSTMNDLIDKVNSSSSCIYTQPYILIALQEFGTTYASQIATLKTEIMAAALASGGWGYVGSTALDANTFAPIILALSPYYSETTTYLDSASVSKTIGAEIDACISTGVISGMQNSTGAISSTGGNGDDDIYATGLVTAAMVSVGKNPTSFVKSGKSLVDGLLLSYDSATCYGNSGANDQAFRGLAAFANYSSGSCFALYDFSDNASLPAYSNMSILNCPLYFSVIPSSAGVVVTDSNSSTVTPLSAGIYDLQAGNYTYTVSASGYTSKTGTVEVVASEASNHTSRTISVSLASAPATSNYITVAFSIKTPANNPGNYTYKHNPSVYSDIVSNTLTLKSGSSVFDALYAGCEVAGIKYTEKTYGYISVINGLSEDDYGSKSGWLFEVGSTVVTANCRGYTLTSDCSVTWFYTDDYTDEYGSENWSPASTTSAETSVTAILDKSTGTANATLSDTELSGFITAISSDSDTVGSKVPITVSTPDGTTKVNLTIPQSALSTLADTSNTSLSIKTDSASLTFDPAAIDSIKGSAGVSDVTFAISKTDSSVLSEENRALVGSYPVYNLSVSASGTKISSFGGGSVEVNIPYTPKNGEDTSKLCVYYIDLDGKATQMSGASYDSALGGIIFKTSHFSTFAVVYDSTKSFADVAERDWFLSSVRFVSKHNLMSGTSDTCFEPNAYMTRAMLVTALYRQEGKPAVTGTNSFTDVQTGQWYTDAVLWAEKSGMVSGYGNGLFGTNDSITREQMAKILYNFAKYKGYDVTKTSDLKVFADACNIGDGAETAISWANAEGLVTGVSSTAIEPRGNATRAQVATVLMRFCEKYLLY